MKNGEREWISPLMKKWPVGDEVGFRWGGLGVLSDYWSVKGNVTGAGTAN